MILRVRWSLAGTVRSGTRMLSTLSRFSRDHRSSAALDLEQLLSKDLLEGSSGEGGGLAGGVGRMTPGREGSGWRRGRAEPRPEVEGPALASECRTSPGTRLRLPTDNIQSGEQRWTECDSLVCDESWHILLIFVSLILDM